MTDKNRTRENPFQPLYDMCNAGDSHRKHRELPAFPRMIDIETTNTCNFRCLMCPTGNYSQQRPKGFLDKELFYRVLEQCKPHGTAIRFIRWGEPLTHPDIIEFVQACTDAGIMTHLNTNGSKLDDHMMDALIGAGLTSLKYSFQGVDRKSYHEMRNTDFFDELLATMRHFKEKRGDRAFPFLHVSTTITYETPEQVATYKRLMADAVDQVSVGRTVLDFIDLNAVRLRPHEVEMLRWLKDKESVIKTHPECPEVFDKMSVDWNGLVTACCMDADNLMVVGDVKENTLAEIWNSENLEHYRRMLADMRHDELPLCTNCYDYQSLSYPDIQQT